jgi:Beta-lactamase class C and other penicillin binding proteins
MRVLKRIAPFVVIAAAALLLLYVPDIAPQKYTDLATFFRIELKRQGYPGLAIAAVADGSVLYVDGFGVDGSGRAITADTPLYVPAMAKSMTALCFASLAREGKLGLDDPVAEYIPSFTTSGGAGGGIALRHLLSHTSGLSDFDFDDRHYDARDLESAVQGMASTKPSSPPGSRFAYIDTDYQALGLAMEKATGLSYPDIVGERVFKPLQMKSSSAKTGAASSGCASFFSLALPRSVPDSAFGASSGYVVASAADIGKYASFLLGPEKAKRGPLPPRAVADLFVPPVQGAPYCYGFFLAEEGGSRVAYHDGSLDGFSSRVALWPDKRTGIVVVATQNSLLKSLFALPALTEGARRIMLEGSSPRPFPLGRVYILLAVVAAMQLLALIVQTGGALPWAKEVRDRVEVKGAPGPRRFAAFRCALGIAVRLALAIVLPYALGRALGRSIGWSLLLEAEPGLAAWCLAACLFGILRNAARLSWLYSRSGSTRLR